VTARTPAVPLVERDAFPAKELHVYDRVASTRGMMGNVFKALANSPGALERVAAVGEFVRFESGLDDQLREAVILTVAGNLRCVYEWTHHWHIAERLGTPEAVLARLATPAAEDEPAPLGPVVRFTRLVTWAEPVPDDLIEQLRGLLGDEGLVELNVTVGYYGLLARVINTFGVPLEEGVEAVGFPDREATR
jgi:4-carboxymuconolactone decarboxylase